METSPDCEGSANHHLAASSAPPYSHLLHCGDLAASGMQGSPQGRVSAPRLALQNLLLNLVQMLHHVPRQALLGADEHLDHLQSHIIITALWFSEREQVQKG